MFAMSYSVHFLEDLGELHVEESVPVRVGVHGLHLSEVDPVLLPPLERVIWSSDAKLSGGARDERDGLKRNMFVGTVC